MNDRSSNRCSRIEMGSWPRAKHYAHFLHYQMPEYRITVPLDISNFRMVVKKKGWSFTLAMNYAVAYCANQAEEFRCRIVDGRPVLYDRIDTAFTYLNKETELFRTIVAPLTSSMAEYVVSAAKIAEKKEGYFDEELPADVFLLTAMPWLAFTQCTHADEGGKRNGMPLFEWGKYEIREGREVMPFTVHVHHSFVDAVHVAKVVKLLQDYLDSL